MSIELLITDEDRLRGQMIRRLFLEVKGIQALNVSHTIQQLSMRFNLFGEGLKFF